MSLSITLMYAKYLPSLRLEVSRPRLGRFHRSHPEVVLDIVAGGFDAGIRVGRNHQDIVVPAVLKGLGILYAYNNDGIAEALARGRLKRVLIY
jgi:DNA-binding transcriptional LysR family regulator